MEKHLKIQDTCGIHNLHAMPGVIGGIVGAITAAAASESVYGKEGWVRWWKNLTAIGPDIQDRFNIQPEHMFEYRNDIVVWSHGSVSPLA